MRGHIYFYSHTSDINEVQIVVQTPPVDLDNKKHNAASESSLFHNPVNKRDKGEIKTKRYISYLCAQALI